MSAGGVAFVAVEAVGRESFVQLAEQPVAMDFGQDGGGGDGDDTQIAFGEAQLGKIQRLELDPIEEQVVGGWREGLDGAAHGEAGGGGDAAGVDFGGGCLAQRPSDSLVLDAIGQLLTTRGRQQLAILDFGPEPGAPGVFG